LVVFSIISFVISFIVKFNFKSNFEKSAKKTILSLVCSCFEKLSWIEGKYPFAFEFLNSLLIKNYSTVTFDNVFSGRHNGIGFDVVEAEFIHKTDQSFDTVFKGVMVKIKLNENFNGHTVMTSNMGFHSNLRSHLQKLNMANVNFEKKFDVYSDNEDEARAFITSQFMAKLRDLRIAFNSYQVDCAFYSKNLYITLQLSNNLLTVGTFDEKMSDSQQFNKMFNGIFAIMQTIDFLKNNQNQQS